jgi:D-threonate/D-erythronate kinase
MIAVIADDLTGAAEIGAVGTRHGLSAEILTLEGEGDSAADLVCIDTDSRSCPPAQAAERAAAAARSLRQQQSDWIYKKVDSVLRGNVIPELEAIQQEIGSTRALLVPANPGLGRTIRNGHYYIHGKPLNETEFAQDPEYPRSSARLLELLPQPQRSTIQLGNCAMPLPQEAIIIGEANAPSDLDQWAQQRGKDVLLAGGSEFFGALLRSAGYTARQPDQQRRIQNRHELFVSGTSSQSARKFIDAEREAGTPIFSLPHQCLSGRLHENSLSSLASEILKVFGENHRTILHVGLPPCAQVETARSLSVQLVRVACAVIGQISLNTVYVDGGATAAELIRQMHWNRLTVLQELGPGVVTLAESHGSGLRLTIKPGSYQWPAWVSRRALETK